MSATFDCYRCFAVYFSNFPGPHVCEVCGETLRERPEGEEPFAGVEVPEEEPAGRVGPRRRWVLARTPVQPQRRGVVRCDGAAAGMGRAGRAAGGAMTARRAETARKHTA